jgi:dUTP pyrophosphatase
LLFNFGENDFLINEGDRIAQMVIEYVVPTEIEEVEDLNDTERGEGGFGSTGVSSGLNNNNHNNRQEIEGDIEKTNEIKLSEKIKK